MVPRFPAAFQPPALASWVLLRPPRDWSLPHGRATGTPTGAWTSTGLSRCTRTRFDWGGCLLDPGNSGVLRLLVASHNRRLPPLNGSVPAPRSSLPIRGAVT